MNSFLRAVHPKDLSITDFTYHLPEDRIAQRPLAERDASRLLVARDGAIEDRVFAELPELLPSNTLLLLNDTRVVNARLVFHRSTGARIEVLCLEPADGVPVEQAFAERGSTIWNAFVGNAKRWKAGETLVLEVPGGASGRMLLRAERIEAEQVRFSWEPAGATFAEVLEQVGHVPLPPYMKRPDEALDKTRYNTVFAHHEGSVAAPTASLHFSADVLERLDAKGIRRASVTLHVGAGTFLPVKSGLMADHAMHGEQVRVPLAALRALAEQLGKGPIIPVGTTALRTLESIYWHGVMVLQGRAGKDMAIGQWEPYEHGALVLPTAREALHAVIEQVRAHEEGGPPGIDPRTKEAGQRLIGRTSILLAPGYTFRFADALITNFHQPQSTLLLLIDAFMGAERSRIYDHALANNYRFLSYGDSSLLWRSS
jgi:S-adenosylmethionine:tRNA ribosyltransferase-isomerase